MSLNLLTEALNAFFNRNELLKHPVYFGSQKATVFRVE